jgi:hypothetical protein
MKPIDRAVSRRVHSHSPITTSGIQGGSGDGARRPWPLRVAFPTGRFGCGLLEIPAGPQFSALVAADSKKSDLDHLFALQIA